MFYFFWWLQDLREGFGTWTSSPVLLVVSLAYNQLWNQKLHLDSFKLQIIEIGNSVLCLIYFLIK